ncbi:hypothetical protein SDC9_141231 [bioreactor metagenome]|uniref:Uncharacterized protein n=1 Tax=bioreactor metagenome TaxID=1076179 RepID=A0A645DY79_9ZZZZ
MSHQRKEIRACEPGWTSAYDSNGFTGLLRASPDGNLSRAFDRRTFNGSDIDSVVYYSSAAARFARMLADERA